MSSGDTMHSFGLFFMYIRIIFMVSIAQFDV